MTKMSKIYFSQSFRSECGKVYLEKQGNYGWKMDVQYPNGEWFFPGGDQVETYLDEIMPYLMRFVNDDCVWMEQETGAQISFWQIIAREFSVV
jgi:hypothetical protein